MDNLLPDRSTDRSRGLGAPRANDSRQSGWRLSSYLVLFAIVFLCGTAVALLVATGQVADRLATYAYYFLVVAAPLRLVEHVVDSRVGSPVTRMPPIGVRNGYARRVRSTIGLTIPMTFVAGLVVVAWQGIDPAVVVSGTYLLGWLLALGFLLAAYATTTPVGRS